MSLGSLSLLPPEIFRLVCYSLPLNDIISLQHTNQLLAALVQNVIFRDFRQLDVDWNHKGAVLCFSAPSSSSVFSISTNSPFWEDVLEMADNVRRVVITKTDDTKDYTVLDAIACREFELSELEIHLCRGKREVSKHSILKGFAQLTSFVGATRVGLRRFRLQTSPDDWVQFEGDGQTSLFHYKHRYDTTICNQLITPLVNCLLRDRAGMTSVTLRIDWTDRLEMILQNAFQAALPYEHRTKLQILRIEFGSAVSTMSEAEIQGVLAEYAPYLNSTINLQHLICDLSHSTLDPSSLEKLYTTISRELSNEQHRISLLTAASRAVTKSAALRRWSDRVSCK